MRLDLSVEICGMPATKMRSFFREWQKRSWQLYTASNLQVFFSIPEMRARQVIEEFERRGLLMRCPHSDLWEINEAGARVGAARITKPILRSTADRCLSEFLE